MSLLYDGSLSITLGSEVGEQFEVGECVAVCLSIDGRFIGIKKRINGYKVRGGNGRSKQAIVRVRLFRARNFMFSASLLQKRTLGEELRKQVESRRLNVSPIKA